ncbi:MAG: hypothetical protein ACR2N3_02330 [Pyrinomonadaceae bacterium]
MKKLKKSWNEFLKKPFPDNCVGKTMEGVELTSLDTFSAGCINSFIDNKGNLNQQQIQTLNDCVRKLHKVVDLLAEAEKDYFEHLLYLSKQVSHEIKERNGEV